MSSRPLLIAGLDPAAARLAERFKEQLGGRLSVLPVRFLSELWIPDIRNNFVRELDGFRRESAEKGCAEEPVLCLWTAAWCNDSPDGVAVATDLSDLLRKWSSSPGLRLAAFFPPLGLASPDQARNVGIVLDRLEQLAGQCEFLDILFLHQVRLFDPLDSQSLQQASLEKETDPDRPIMPPPSQPAQEAELPNEILYRELCHPAIGPQVQRLASQSIGHKAAFRGQKACFATAGFHQLVHPAKDSYSHFASQFQWQILKQGLLGPVNTTFEFYADLQKRASNFVEKLLSDGITRLSPVLQKAQSDIALIDAPEWELCAAALLREIDEWRLKLADPLAEFDKSLAFAADAELVGYLNTATRAQVYLSGANIYVNILLGDSPFEPSQIEEESRKAERDLAPELISVRGVLDRFIWMNQDKALSELFRNDIAPALAELGASVLLKPLNGRDAFSQLCDQLEKNKSLLGDLGTAEGACVRLCFGFLQAVAEMACLPAESCDAEAVLRLLPDLLGKEASILKMLYDRLAEECEQEENKLREQFGSKLKRIFRRAEYEKQQERCRQLKAARDSVPPSFDKLTLYALKLLREHAIPIFCRIRIAEHVIDAIEKAVSSYREFVASAVRRVEQRRDADTLQSLDTPEQSSILTPTRISKLYDRGKQDLDWIQHANRMLLYLPKEQKRQNQVSYLDCQALGDHFQTGLQSLLQRLNDYALDCFAWFPNLDWMDIILLPVPLEESGERILERVRKYFLNVLEIKWDEKPGAEIYPDDFLLVEIAEHMAADFIGKFGHIFGGRIQIAGESDPWKVRLTGVIRGIPRILIRGLKFSEPNPDSSALPQQES